MSGPRLTSKLTALSDPNAYPDVGVPLVRWGQIIRTTPSAANLLASASEAGRLVPLSSLAKVRSGVVSRANAFFIVEELPFDQIPNRFHITRKDLSTVTVALDGLNAPHRFRRKHLRKIIKGPDSLISPSEIQHSHLRVFNVEESPQELRKAKDNDTLAYLRRGETVNYSVSADKLKGGIPAERSNIKNRKPHWYSLNVPKSHGGRLVLPEHFDQRFIATAIAEDVDDYVVIDTCYLVECHNPAMQGHVLACLNSMLTWYQIELRGRTQHGEGVLKVKIPDFQGLLILDPSTMTSAEAQSLQNTFSPVAHRKTLVVAEELTDESRAAFDRSYLQLSGIASGEVEGTRMLIARELREAMSERRTRPESVADLKAQRAPKQRITRQIDAFAARIVSQLPLYPDPRTFFDILAIETAPITIPEFSGPLTQGSGLFESGHVFAGSAVIAATESADAARFIRTVLTLDPDQRIVDLPHEDTLATAIKRWSSEVDAWWTEFLGVEKVVVGQIIDPKLASAVRNRALEIAHASETPETRVIGRNAPKKMSGKKPRKTLKP
jgi:hypothetical protein